MDLGIAVLLFLAGVAGGVVNAIAGGATLITFPAMLAAGLPAVVANASNAVAVTPGHLFAALADRSRLPALDKGFAIAVVGAVIGGAAGAVLLLTTPERLFVLLVPALIALATLVFAFGRRVQATLTSSSGINGSRARYVLMLPVTAYGGYFGAGLGVMLLAVLTTTGTEDVRTANALKNVLATATSFVTIAIFVVQGVIRWPETLVMLIGAVAGGLVGGKLITVLPAGVVRALVIALGTLMTVIYAWRYWF
ncbi:MAG: sulfite exporter TauE/SafE family protein [Xanthobacteraceae bacterium]|nr:sulfite exporter TauE/SafE family protein [Xanthobacteraceae bacterium]